MKKEMKILFEKMCEYNKKIVALKSKLSEFAYQIEEDIRDAERRINCGDKAMIGQGVRFAGGIAGVCVGFAVAGPPGALLATISIGWSAITAKRGLQAYNADRPVVEAKKRNEKLLYEVLKQYKELHDRDIKVKMLSRM